VEGTLFLLGQPLGVAMGDDDRVEPNKLNQRFRFIVMKEYDGNGSTCMPEYLVCTVQSMGKAPLGPSRSPTTPWVEDRVA
jgi:hypothetical protein